MSYLKCLLALSETLATPGGDASGTLLMKREAVSKKAVMVSLATVGVVEVMVVMKLLIL